MEKITLEFSGMPFLMIYDAAIPIVTLTLDDTGKHVSIEKIGIQAVTGRVNGRDKMTLTKQIPNRILKSFTERSIARILSKDEIPNKSEMVLLDGNDYTIVIRKGEITKKYHCDDCSIETYPLLRYLASWYRRI